ncbi:MAG: M3 family oligoendopeptidase, partial [Bacillota bacterium]
MKFQDYTYERPNMELYVATFKEALEQFKDAKTVDAQEAAMDTINKLRFDFETMQTLTSIRHSVDTKDEFYDKEKDFFDENSPTFVQLNNLFYEALSSARFEKELRKRKGALLFKQAEQSLRTFSDTILEDLKKENALTSQYQKLLASAEIEFEGEIRNLSQMAPFAQSKDRDTRKAASQAVSAFFEANEDTLDTLYDDLVQIRTSMAKKLGYDSFTELAYDRLGRLDYGPKEVANYRKQVREVIVPIANKLVERQGKRLGIEDMKSYDLSLKFLSGNPTPKGKKAWLVDRASTMYKEMSKETDEFFTFMKERNLMDLEAKKGK